MFVAVHTGGRGASDEGAAGLAVQGQLLNTPSLSHKPLSALSGRAWGSENHISSANFCVWGAQGVCKVGGRGEGLSSFRSSS